jgi:hypothetical protein
VLVSILVTLASRIYKGDRDPLKTRSPDHSTPKAIQITIQDVGYYASYGPNLSKFCVPCTFEFLISASPYLKLTTSGISLGGQPVKHRQRVVGKMYNLCRLKTNISVILTVKTGLDHYMIIELKDDLN